MDPVVHLSSSASLKGTTTYLEDSTKPVYTYLGIPFAEPPIGKLRLKKPVPKKLWEGQRDATKCGPGPSQDLGKVKYLFPPMGLKSPETTGEDCLYLSVYTPTKNASDSLPVMVWIFGGGFFLGSVDCYIGTAFAALHDVILVAISYRVGTLGFFSTGDETCLGNFGLWDQIEGMKWVQEHISKFGGDPNNVTLFGESAGSMSTSLHHVAKASHGLFNKAIHISGVGNVRGPLFSPQKCRDLCTKAAQAMELPEDSSPADVHAALMAMPAEDIVKKLAPVSYVPTRDGDLFTLDSLASYEKGDFYKSNSIFTMNTHEGMLFYNLEYKPKGTKLQTRDDFSAFLKVFLAGMQGKYPIKDIDGFAKVLMQEYLPQENPTADEVFLTAIELMGDATFCGAIDTFAKLHSDGVPKGTYYGVYGYRWSGSQYMSQVKAIHAEDVAIEFGIPLLRTKDQRQVQWSEADKNMSKTMLAYFCNFAKTGSPSGPSSSHLPIWPCFTSRKPTYLYMDETCSLGEDYKAPRRRFWSTVPQRFA